MNKKVTLFFIALLKISLSLAQQKIAEVKLQYNKVDNFQAIPSGDSVFISFSTRDNNTKGLIQKGYLIRSDGIVQNNPLPLPGNASLIGNSSVSEQNYYYFIDRASKRNQQSWLSFKKAQHHLWKVLKRMRFPKENFWVFVQATTYSSPAMTKKRRY